MLHHFFLVSLAGPRHVSVAQLRSIQGILVPSTKNPLWRTKPLKQDQRCGWIRMPSCVFVGNGCRRRMDVIIWGVDAELSGVMPVVSHILSLVEWAMLLTGRLVYIIAQWCNCTSDGELLVTAFCKLSHNEIDYITFSNPNARRVSPPVCDCFQRSISHSNSEIRHIQHLKHPQVTSKRETWISNQNSVEPLSADSSRLKVVMKRFLSAPLSGNIPVPLKLIISDCSCWDLRAHYWPHTK